MGRSKVRMIPWSLKKKNMFVYNCKPWIRVYGNSIVLGGHKKNYKTKWVKTFQSEVTLFCARLTASSSNGTSNWTLSYSGQHLIQCWKKVSNIERNTLHKGTKKLKEKTNIRKAITNALHWNNGKWRALKINLGYPARCVCIIFSRHEALYARGLTLLAIWP